MQPNESEDYVAKVGLMDFINFRFSINCQYHKVIQKFRKTVFDRKPYHDDNPLPRVPCFKLLVFRTWIQDEKVSLRFLWLPSWIPDIILCIVFTTVSLDIAHFQHVSFRHIKSRLFSVGLHICGLIGTTLYELFTNSTIYSNMQTLNNTLNSP